MLYSIILCLYLDMCMCARVCTYCQVSWRYINVPLYYITYRLIQNASVVFTVQYTQIFAFPQFTYPARFRISHYLGYRPTIYLSVTKSYMHMYICVIVYVRCILIDRFMMPFGCTPVKLSLQNPEVSTCIRRQHTMNDVLLEISKSNDARHGSYMQLFSHITLQFKRTFIALL